MIYYNNLELTDSQFSLYLIKTYIDKHFKDISLNELMKRYTSNQLARALGKKDISFFCLYYLRDIFVASDDNAARELSPTHFEMWDTLNKVFIDDTINKLNIVCPRGMAKTTVCDLALTVWLVCYKQSEFTLLGAKKDDDACQFIDSIKKVFKENDYIIKEFGELINSKKYKVNANEIEFANGVYLRAAGSSTSVRGLKFKEFRPTVVIADKTIIVRTL